MSIVAIARLYPKPGHTTDVLAALAYASPSILAEQGCELYAGHEAPDGTILMIEKWATQADLDAHLAGEPVRAYRDARAPFEERTPQLEILTPLEGADPERGMI
ncbi:MAG TPA: putative quinol monooxygenase [Microbacteriaceae bacterium]|nr:putative quinol monooxygenase [Microbacteriaceae bacterium]